MWDGVECGGRAHILRAAAWVLSGITSGPAKSLSQNQILGTCSRQVKVSAKSGPPHPDPIGSSSQRCPSEST